MPRVPSVTCNSSDAAQCRELPFWASQSLINVMSGAEGNLSIWVNLVNNILQPRSAEQGASGEAKYLGRPHKFNSVVSVGDANDLEPIVVGCRNGPEKGVEPTDVGLYST